MNRGRLPAYLTATKDLDRYCRWCGQPIRRGERYRVCGWDLIWNVRRWTHKQCDKDAPREPPA